MSSNQPQKTGSSNEDIDDAKVEHAFAMIPKMDVFNDGPPTNRQSRPERNRYVQELDSSDPALPVGTLRTVLDPAQTVNGANRIDVCETTAHGLTQPKEINFTGDDGVTYLVDALPFPDRYYPTSETSLLSRKPGFEQHVPKTEVEHAACDADYTQDQTMLESKAYTHQRANQVEYAGTFDDGRVLPDSNMMDTTRSSDMYVAGGLHAARSDDAVRRQVLLPTIAGHEETEYSGNVEAYGQGQRKSEPPEFILKGIAPHGAFPLMNVGSGVARPAERSKQADVRRENLRSTPIANAVTGVSGPTVRAKHTDSSRVQHSISPKTEMQHISQPVRNSSPLRTARRQLPGTAGQKNVIPTGNRPPQVPEVVHRERVYSSRIGAPNARPAHVNTVEPTPEHTKPEKRAYERRGTPTVDAVQFSRRVASAKPVRERTQAKYTTSQVDVEPPNARMSERPAPQRAERVVQQTGVATDSHAYVPLARGSVTDASEREEQDRIRVGPEDAPSAANFRVQPQPSASCRGSTLHSFASGSNVKGNEWKQMLPGLEDNTKSQAVIQQALNRRAPLLQNLPGMSVRPT